MGIRGLKWIKCKNGQKPNREVEHKIQDESRVRQMVETELYLLSWEVRKIMDDMRLERTVLSKLHKAS